MFASAWSASLEIFAVSGRSPRCSGAVASASAPSIQSDDDGVVKPWAIRSAATLCSSMWPSTPPIFGSGGVGWAGIVPTAR